MKILEYIGLDTSGVKASYGKVSEAIARQDFRAAQVKKLANLSHGKFYRAKLDDADRLLFALVRRPFIERHLPWLSSAALAAARPL